MFRTQTFATAALCAGLSSLGASGVAQDQDLIEAARVTLAKTQTDSFIYNREYCGLIGRNAAGQLVATRPRQGWKSSCRPRSFFSADIEALASYHTHGAQVPGETVETPSTYDLQADAEEGILGFVATPGGRFWVIEPEKGRVRMLCGAGCLPSDPNYDATLDEGLKPLYTARELEQLEAGG